MEEDTRAAMHDGIISRHYVVVESVKKLIFRIFFRTSQKSFHDDGTIQVRLKRVDLKVIFYLQYQQG